MEKNNLLDFAQWVRTDKNKIYFKHNYLVERDYLFKVASTPQKLIEVGDLVGILHLIPPTPVIYISEKGVMTIEKEECIGFEHITKIYTPNEDKSQYTLQWEAILSNDKTLKE